MGKLSSFSRARRRVDNTRRLSAESTRPMSSDFLLPMALPVHCNFTRQHYRDILVAAGNLGYRFVSFGDFSPGLARQIILRHDIDLSMEAAVDMAAIEADLGVTSVYHFLLSAEVYNLRSQAGRFALEEIRGGGHQLGLHVDPMAICGGRTEDPDFYGELEKLFSAASSLMGPLDSYSLHRPAVTGRAGDLLPERLSFSVPPYAYSTEFMKEIVYRSDSRREWRQGCIHHELPSLEGRSLQLLIHPIWWTDAEISRKELLAQFVGRQMESAGAYLRSNLSFEP
jgi:hypothetical protein